MCNFGLVEMLCNVIVFSQERDLKQEAILDLISLLLGGNNACQKKFFEYLQMDRKNDFLINIKKMINVDFLTIKKGMNTLNKEFIFNYFSEKSEKFK